MHLLDFILVLVLLPCTNANKPIANNSCGHLEVQTPSLLFYGRNVTITFKAYKYKDATPQLIYNVKPTISYQPHTHDNEKDIFTFLLLLNRTDKRRQDYYVNNTCSSDTISFEMREPPALGPRTNITGCDGCLIASVGDKTDTFKNKEPLISCSMTNATEWTVSITINNKFSAARNYSNDKYVIKYTVIKDDNMTTVECSMTFDNLTLVDKATLYVQGISTTPSQSPKPDFTYGVSSLSTKQDFTSSAHITQSSTGKATTSLQSPKQSVTSVYNVQTTHFPKTTSSSQTSSAQNTLRKHDTVTMQSKQTKQTEVKTGQTSTRQPLTITDKETASVMFVTESIENDVLNTSSKKDGNQLIIIATVCGISVCVIAVIIAVVCVKRNGRTTGRDREEVVQEEGYARIKGAECQYAVVNKPKKPFAPQAIQTLDVENKFIELQSQPKKHLGAGELIYADLDKEALTAKPTNSTFAGILKIPSTPTEYVSIDFARTVALQDANKQDE